MGSIARSPSAPPPPSEGEGLRRVDLCQSFKMLGQTNVRRDDSVRLEVDAEGQRGILEAVVAGEVTASRVLADSPSVES